MKFERWIIVVVTLFFAGTVYSQDDMAIEKDETNDYDDGSLLTKEPMGTNEESSTFKIYNMLPAKPMQPIKTMHVNSVDPTKPGKNLQDKNWRPGQGRDKFEKSEKNPGRGPVKKMDRDERENLDHQHGPNNKFKSDKLPKGTEKTGNQDENDDRPGNRRGHNKETERGDVHGSSEKNKPPQGKGRDNEGFTDSPGLGKRHANANQPNRGNRDHNDNNGSESRKTKPKEESSDADE